jgi:hypothetical protein
MQWPPSISNNNMAYGQTCEVGGHCIRLVAMVTICCYNITFYCQQPSTRSHCDDTQKIIFYIEQTIFRVASPHSQAKHRRRFKSRRFVRFFFLFLGTESDCVHLVHRPLITLQVLYQPRMTDDECGAVGGMRIGRRNRRTRRKPAPVSYYSSQNPHDLTWARTRAADVWSRRVTVWAMARPDTKIMSNEKPTKWFSTDCEDGSQLFPPKSLTFTGYTASHPIK